MNDIIQYIVLNSAKSLDVYTLRPIAFDLLPNSGIFLFALKDGLNSRLSTRWQWNLFRKSERAGWLLREIFPSDISPKSWYDATMFLIGIPLYFITNEDMIL